MVLRVCLGTDEPCGELIARGSRWALGPDRSERRHPALFTLLMVEATTGIEPVYAVLQTAP